MEHHLAPGLQMIHQLSGSRRRPSSVCTCQSHGECDGVCVCGRRGSLTARWVCVKPAFTSCETARPQSGVSPEVAVRLCGALGGGRGVIVGHGARNIAVPYIHVPVFCILFLFLFAHAQFYITIVHNK